MKWKIIFSILGLAIIISLIEPVKFYFADKTVTEIPVYISYEQAIFEELPQKIIAEAVANNCRDYILPVEEISEQAGLPLRGDINLALASHKDWRLAVSSEENELMRKRFASNINRWASTMSERELIERTGTQRAAALNTRYSSKAKLSRIPNAVSNDYQLTVTVNDERNFTELFSVMVNFAHPATVRKWEAAKKVRESEIAELIHKDKKGKWSALIFSVLLLILLPVPAVESHLYKKKRNLYLAMLEGQIETRQDLIDNGHFVAALELADKYLAEFPHNIEIKAFRERLLDFTNNDPKKAQVAFVEAKKLQARIQNRELYLTEQEKENISGLIPYHGELGQSFKQLTAYAEEDRIREENRGKIDQIRCLVEDRKYLEADKKVKQLPRINDEELEALKSEIKEELEISENKYQQVLSNLEEGAVSDAKKVLKELLERNPDYQKGIDLSNTLNQSILKDGFCLASCSADMKISVFSKRELILGRDDEGVNPDIVVEDRHVSRPHLKVLLDGKQVQIEDLQSTGGTYINGERVTKHSLNNGETLVLAKMVDVHFHILKGGDGSIGGLLMTILGKMYVVLNSELGFGIKNDKFQIRDADTSLSLKEGVVIAKTREGVSVLSPKSVIEISGTKYQVERV